MLPILTALLALSAITVQAADVSFVLLDQPAVETRLRAGAVPAQERQALIEKLFREAGCQIELQKLDRHSSNVICTLTGKTADIITIGAHYDFIDKGKGIVDDWSGVSLLPSLYQTLKTKQRRYTYRFVAFTGEEIGLLGSSLYVSKLNRDQRARTKAFVNLECLGVTPPKVWARRSTPFLVQMLSDTATAIHVPLKGVNIDKVGDDDTHPFLDKKIPVICIHSVTQDTFGILHTERDDFGVIHPDDFYDAYRLVAYFLNYLDAGLPANSNP